MEILCRLAPRFVCGMVPEIRDKKERETLYLPDSQEARFNSKTGVQVSPYKEKIIETFSKKIPNIGVFTIQHKRKGEHVVFQIKL